MSPWSPEKPPKKHCAQPPATPAQEAARLRFEKAIAALEPLEAAVVMHVAITDLPIAVWSPPLGFRNGFDRSVELLRAGLAALIRHCDAMFSQAHAAGGRSHASTQAGSLQA